MVIHLRKTTDCGVRDLDMAEKISSTIPKLRRLKLATRTASVNTERRHDTDGEMRAEIKAPRPSRDAFSGRGQFDSTQKKTTLLPNDRRVRWTPTVSGLLQVALFIIKLITTLAEAQEACRQRLCVCGCLCVCWGVSLASNVSGFRFYINISHGNWIQTKLAWHTRGNRLCR